MTGFACIFVFEYADPKILRRFERPVIVLVVLVLVYGLANQYILKWLSTSRIVKRLSTSAKWPVNKILAWSRAKTEKRLAQLNEPDFIETERHARDKSVLMGLFLISIFLLLSVFTLMASHPLMKPTAPPVNPASVVMWVIVQLLCAMASVKVFLDAMVHHESTNPQNIKKERERLETKLKPSSTELPRPS